MTTGRYKQLNGPDEFAITDEELKEGWHFCIEFDGLCRNSNDEVFKCNCNEFQNLQHDAHCVHYFCDQPIELN
jgi:hypothetical protein